MHPPEPVPAVCAAAVALDAESERAFVLLVVHAAWQAVAYVFRPDAKAALRQRVGDLCAGGVPVDADEIFLWHGGELWRQVGELERQQVDGLVHPLGGGLALVRLHERHARHIIADAEVFGADFVQPVLCGWLGCEYLHQRLERGEKDSRYAAFRHVVMLCGHRTPRRVGQAFQGRPVEPRQRARMPGDGVRRRPAGDLAAQPLQRLVHLPGTSAIAAAERAQQGVHVGFRIYQEMPCHEMLEFVERLSRIHLKEVARHPSPAEEVGVRLHGVRRELRIRVCELVVASAEPVVPHHHVARQLKPAVDLHGVVAVEMIRRGQRHGMVGLRIDVAPPDDDVRLRHDSAGLWRTGARDVGEYADLHVGMRPAYLPRDAVCELELEAGVAAFGVSARNAVVLGYHFAAAVAEAEVVDVVELGEVVDAGRGLRAAAPVLVSEAPQRFEADAPYVGVGEAQSAAGVLGGAALAVRPHGVVLGMLCGIELRRHVEELRVAASAGRGRHAVAAFEVGGKVAPAHAGESLPHGLGLRIAPSVVHPVVEFGRVDGRLDEDVRDRNRELRVGVVDVMAVDRDNVVSAQPLGKLGNGVLRTPGRLAVQIGGAGQGLYAPVPVAHALAVDAGRARGLRRAEVDGGLWRWEGLAFLANLGRDAGNVADHVRQVGGGDRQSPRRGLVCETRLYDHGVGEAEGGGGEQDSRKKRVHRRGFPFPLPT